MKCLGKILVLLCCIVVIPGTVSVQASDTGIYFIRSVANSDLSWDIGSDDGKGGEIGLWTRDYGADRFIKVIEHPEYSNYVYFQPQHSFLVADIAGNVRRSGAKLQLWKQGANNLGQLFKMKQVQGEANTYYIQNVGSTLYLAANDKGNAITQKEYQANDHTLKWYFKKADTRKMNPPSAGKIYAIQNVMSRRFIDIPGRAPNQKGKDGELQLWDMDYEPDRYMMLHNVGDGYFCIQPLHSKEVWQVEGSGKDNGTTVQLWPIDKSANQRFKFEYAGEPNTYYIKSFDSGKYVDASHSQIKNNGCKIQIWAKNNNDNQKWRLYGYDKWHIPPQNKVFYIKSAYANKYWDIGGDGAETNKNGAKIQMWSLNSGNDRKYMIAPSGDHSWVHLQAQNGGRFLDIPNGTSEDGAQMQLYQFNGSNAQKFAIQPTSPTTFALRTKHWKSVDIAGGSGNKEWDKNGANLIQYDSHYRVNQQFQLVYANNPDRKYNFMSKNLEHQIPTTELYFIKSVAYQDLSWDLDGYHFDAKDKGGRINLEKGDRGADRFIKIIPHPTRPGYVFFQPQHSDYVAEISGDFETPGSEVRLRQKDENKKTQMFEMVPVEGADSTYYIKNVNSDLYLTAQGQGKKITQENYLGDNTQKWHFEKRYGNEMAPPSAGKIYAIENVMAEKFIDIPGIAPNQERKDGELQLWDMDYAPDRYMMLRNVGDGYFFIQPLHSKEVWDVEGSSDKNGTDLQLWSLDKTANQRFKFEYAGQPRTYRIKSLDSGKYVDASYSKINENGCNIQLWHKNGGDNQKWRLHSYDKWQMPPEDQVFYIKSAYTNKYWDVSGDGAETNKNGANVQMWGYSTASDRKYKIKPSGDHSWIYIQAQNGGRVLDIPKGSGDNYANMHLYESNGSNAQKFAIQFTSPITFALRTKHWKSVDIKGGSSDEWKKNGADLIQYDSHYGKNQQFQLIYASGEKEGEVYNFTDIDIDLINDSINDSTNHPITFTRYTLSSEQERLLGRNGGNCYTYFHDSDGNLILVIYGSVQSTGGYKVKVNRVVEEGGKIKIYIEEVAPGFGDPRTMAFSVPRIVIKINRSNENIVIIDKNGNTYEYFHTAN